MRSRVVLVAVLVLVLGAWTCAPTNSPGSGGSDVPISTTGLTALVAGEDWHYVGEAGEPAWVDFFNVGGEEPALAFRLREGGIVDIAGVIAAVGGSAVDVFVIPEGYRPAHRAYVPAVRDRSGAYSIRILLIDSDGTVSVVGGGTDAGDQFTVSGTFFLLPPGPS